uniref:DUF86 domain-containing protein n=1 Tax=Thermorudis sp. TaxID=1969470 RepID=A0A7C3APP2_9BACT
MSFEDFAADRKRVDAVVRNVEIISAAVGYIPLEMQQGYSAIPWRQMRGIRLAEPREPTSEQTMGMGSDTLTPPVSKNTRGKLPFTALAITAETDEPASHLA